MVHDHDFQHDTVAAKAPISAHPAFPLIVGLWFAALLGLGTVVLPATVLEKVAGVTGLAGVFPQAAPPLSTGARLAFAVLATVIGLMLARRIAEGQTAEIPARRRAPRAGQRAAPPRPLSIHDDLGEEAIAPTSDEGQAPFPGRRRRALTVPKSDGLDDFLHAAPLPGDDTVTPPALPADEAPDEVAAVFGEAAEIPLPAADEDYAEADAPEAYVPAFDTRKPRDLPAPPSPEIAPQALTLEPIDVPLEDLGIVQLAERLGRSMQRRLTALETRSEVPESEALAVPPPVVPDALRAFMDGPPEQFAEASAASPRRFDAPETDAGHGFDDEAEDDEDEILVEGSFSSLLSMNGAFRPAADEIAEAEDVSEPETVRPFEVPPAAASAHPRLAPDPVETERALRSALANLQRMSGAA